MSEEHAKGRIPRHRDGVAAMTQPGGSDLLVVGPLKQQIVQLLGAVLPDAREVDERKKLTAGEADALLVMIDRVIRVNTRPAPPSRWTPALGWCGR